MTLSIPVIQVLLSVQFNDNMFIVLIVIVIIQHFILTFDPHLVPLLDLGFVISKEMNLEQISHLSVRFQYLKPLSEFEFSNVPLKLNFFGKYVDVTPKGLNEFSFILPCFASFNDLILFNMLKELWEHTWHFFNDESLVAYMSLLVLVEFIIIYLLE